jgi:hypothetical protein
MTPSRRRRISRRARRVGIDMRSNRCPSGSPSGERTVAPGTRRWVARGRSIFGHDCPGHRVGAAPENCLGRRYHRRTTRLSVIVVGVSVNGCPQFKSMLAMKRHGGPGPPAFCPCVWGPPSIFRATSDRRHSRRTHRGRVARVIPAGPAWSVRDLVRPHDAVKVARGESQRRTLAVVMGLQRRDRR